MSKKYEVNYSILSMGAKEVSALNKDEAVKIVMQMSINELIDENWTSHDTVKIHEIIEEKDF